MASSQQKIDNTSANIIAQCNSLSDNSHFWGGVYKFIHHVDSAFVIIAFLVIGGYTIYYDDAKHAYKMACLSLFSAILHGFNVLWTFEKKGIQYTNISVKANSIAHKISLIEDDETDSSKITQMRVLLEEFNELSQSYKESEVLGITCKKHPPVSVSTPVSREEESKREPKKKPKKSTAAEAFTSIELPASNPVLEV